MSFECYVDVQSSLCSIILTLLPLMFFERRKISFYDSHLSMQLLLNVELDVLRRYRSCQIDQFGQVLRGSALWWDQVNIRSFRELKVLA